MSNPSVAVYKGLANAENKSPQVVDQTELDAIYRSVDAKALTLAYQDEKTKQIKTRKALAYRPSLAPDGQHTGILVYDLDKGLSGNGAAEALDSALNAYPFTYRYGRSISGKGFFLEVLAERAPELTEHKKLHKHIYNLLPESIRAHADSTQSDYKRWRVIGYNATMQHRPGCDRVPATAPVEPIGVSGKTFTDARELLSRLDPDMGYNEWIKVGIILHNEFKGHQSACKLWDDWSRANGEADKWEEGICPQKWATFKPSGQLTWGSLHYMVKQATGDGHLRKLYDGGEALKEALAELRLEVRYNKRGNRTEIRRLDYGDWDAQQWTESLADRKTISPDGWILCTDHVAANVVDLFVSRFKLADGRKQFSKAWFFDSVMVLESWRREDPFLEWLKGLPKWDGTPRLERHLIECLGAEDTEYVREVSRRFILGAVGRAYDPGSTHDWAPILVGEQGGGKSLYAKQLLPYDEHKEWFSDSIDLGASVREKIEAAGPAVICEFEELEGITRADIPKLKSFISSPADYTRLSYRRNSELVQRMWVGIGTANDDGNGVLPEDKTGSRRWAVVEVKKAGYQQVSDWLKANREQLWAEARHVYTWHKTPVHERNGLHVLPDWLLDVQTERNARHESVNEPLRNFVLRMTRKYAGTGEARAVTAIIEEMDATERVAIGGRGGGLVKAVTGDLKKLGWTAKRTMYGRFWMPPEKEEE